ncbi:hypothetical protein E2542_SST23971 [Spatholobus suberectus]|nr:hypothetical protein E2542_SST23971 [Spatholobus suberectus]
MTTFPGRLFSLKIFMKDDENTWKSKLTTNMHPKIGFKSLFNYNIYIRIASLSSYSRTHIVIANGKSGSLRVRQKPTPLLIFWPKKECIVDPMKVWVDPPVQFRGF